MIIPHYNKNHQNCKIYKLIIKIRISRLIKFTNNIKIRINSSNNKEWPDNSNIII